MKVVVLRVNGEVWFDSGSVFMVHYQNSVSRQVGCGETLDVGVTATNEIEQTATATGSITTPAP